MIIQELAYLSPDELEAACLHLSVSLVAEIKKRVLIMISVIDDDASVRKATKALLRSLGHQVTTFSSAEKFLKSEQLRHTLCVISDVHMKGLSGVELQEHLKDANRSIPVIFITGSPEEHIRMNVMRAGAFGFLIKPFSAEQLILALDRALTSDRSWK